MISRVSTLIIRLFGWKFVGELFTEDKSVALIAPHTSWMDFLWGRLISWAMGIEMKVIIKKELFVFPFGRLLKACGGIPLDRKDRRSKMLEQIVTMFNESEKLLLTVAPEGTRRKRMKWKRGFYEIAVRSNVPIYIVRIDYTKKELNNCKLFYPTGDYAQDLEYIQSYYNRTMAKYPDQFAKEY